MKTRLLGAAVLIALAVLFVPMFFSSAPPAGGGDQAVSLAIPPAPDRDLQTRTMSLDPNAAAGGTTVVPATPGQVPAPSDQLATVNIGSSRPRDVEIDPEAGKQPEPTTVTRGGATAPMIPAQPPQSEPAPAPTEPVIKQQPVNTPVVAAAPAAGTAGTAARGHYTLNLSAYASAASAQRLIQQVRALGYPASGRTVQQGGKALTRVTAGPFDTRTAAEAARLKITQTIAGAPAHLESGASDQRGDAPARAAVTTAANASTARAGGFAVQVAAMAGQADANALRDKLRAAGFDGFVDSVNAGGQRLWRVRAGPQTGRDDALRVRDQIKAKLGLSGNVVSVP